MTHPLLALTFSLLPALAAADRTTIGLTAGGKPIEAVSVGQVPDLPARTVVVIGGLDGTPATPHWDAHGFRVLTIPLANPDKATLIFPPTGAAYKENPESHCLWRWIGSTAPDLVVILSKDDFGLGQALSENAVCGIGRIPVRRTLPKAGEPLPMSEAHREIERRLARTPHQVALELAEVYGHDFPQAVYIPAMALIGRLRLGDRADVERLTTPFVEGGKDSLAHPRPRPARRWYGAAICHRARFGDGVLNPRFPVTPSVTWKSGIEYSVPEATARPLFFPIQPEKGAVWTLKLEYPIGFPYT